ncbi:uncharacterized protein L3040_000522 [Drepanopeziza brunnea f. sp. 'multigermtubi']|uniref:uncharacterized protein n=1 Tax=Drepanopeziza brunnea f. sp. 'multigermtubi' TaxID=698441 RepID=UPI002395CD86|nr:hypothetical protein L3040_000522 [Drepanopeziza brunnea f. sp. 'multigermtubi']
MDEFTHDAFANRDSPIPVIRFDALNDLSEEVDDRTDDVESKRDQIHRHGKDVKENMKKVQQKTSEKGSSMQDRLLEKLLQQVIPSEDLSSSRAEASSTQGFSTRPSFSLPAMSANFRRFNARIGVVFVFQAKVIRLLSWNTPTHTLSFLAIYTFICLDPYLLTVLPFAVILLALLIPAFIARHPAPPPAITTSSHTASFGYSASGPPLAPAPTVKPVKELSKDFFRNMRDLQNSMEDFSRAHDKLIAILTPPTNFSNEPLSSTLFLFAFFVALTLFIASHLLPWRFLFLAIGWTVTCSGHPTIQRQLVTTHKQHVAPREKEAKSYLESWIARDIILDSAPETREVEIFELQRLSSAGEWENWLFSSSPYDPLSETRLSSDRPKGTRFFEDVQPPPGWEWSEKKWALDLWSREWVEERIITGVEVETEGERWVYDIRYEYEKSAAFGEEGCGLGTPVNLSGNGKKKALPSWEEGSDAEGKRRGRRGEWRRRRWVRMVKRRWQPRRPVSEGG